MIPFALERLRFPAAVPASPRTRVVARHEPGNRFLKGPIPMAWLSCAIALPGKAVHVGLVLWFHSGLARSNRVSVSMSSFTRYGVSRYAAARGLAALERAGLVTCERAPGRKARVEILSRNSGQVKTADGPAPDGRTP